MFYQVAGLNIAVFGNGTLQRQQVSFVKSLNDVYKRKENAAFLDENKASSEENFSSDDSSFFLEDTEFAANAQPFSAQELHIKVQGCPCDEQGNALYVLKRMADYAVQLPAGAAQNVFVPDFRIQYKILERIGTPEGEDLGNLRGFSVIQQADGTVSFLKKIKEIEEVLARIDFNASFSEADISLFDVSGLGGLPLEDRVHAYIGEAFSYMALLKGRVVFHSSAMAYDGQGVCFSAPSGTGKSTHTGLWKTYYGNKTEIVNDDTPVLYINNGKTVLSGTPWSGKTELNINKEVPLKGIVFLTRSKENFIKELSNLEALKEMFGEAKIPRIPVLFHAGLEIVGHVLEKTPVYLLGCNISKEAVDLVKETLKF